MAKLNHTIYRIGVVAVLVACNFAFAQAIPSIVQDFSDAEKLTIERMKIAFGLGFFTQFFAAMFFNKTKPWTKWLAQTVLAGVVAAVFIGLTRDSIGLKLQIGGETALASLIGWIGIEAAFARLDILVKEILSTAIKSILNALGAANKLGGKDE